MHDTTAGTQSVLLFSSRLLRTWGEKIAFHLKAVEWVSSLILSQTFIFSMRLDLKRVSLTFSIVKADFAKVNILQIFRPYVVNSILMKRMNFVLQNNK